MTPLRQKTIDAQCYPAACLKDCEFTGVCMVLTTGYSRVEIAKHIFTTRAAQHVYYQAKKRAGIKKGRGIHTLRHCFATHLLEAGVDLPTLQMLMGHKSVTNTMVYLQLTTKKLSSVESPLDLLQIPTRL